MKTAPTNKKVREIISMVKEEKLLPRPEFQRRLVWSRDDKNHFLDSVLRGYPFPEIYLADGDVNLETGDGTQLLVDGLQRVNTLIQYFDGDDELKLTTVSSYRALDESAKLAFLQYDVAVRDLGSISRDEIVEVFKRLNATKYSLLDIEVNNAVYAGALKQFCERFTEHSFFKEHAVFNTLDLKRMGDLRYVLGLVGTLLQGYFNRDDAFEDLLQRFNDEFPQSNEIAARLESTFQFIDECGFETRSRIWKKADLFTVIIELDQALNIQHSSLLPSEVLQRLNTFWANIEEPGTGALGTWDPLRAVYYKAALQASNDRINRYRRGIVLEGVINAVNPDDLYRRLVRDSLI